jgi:phage-related baseplate assembly protein
MSIFQFVPINPNQIITDTKAKYEQLAGYSLSPADVEMIMIHLMAYREQNILAKMETVEHQNFVQLASGSALDYWGELLGVIGLLNEDDEDYRQRILAQNRFAPVGTRGAYIAKAKAVAGVADCVLTSRQDDLAMSPGFIAVTLIEKIAAGQTTIGDVASPALEASVLAAFNDYQTNVIGDIFVFHAAVPVPISGAITVRKILGENTNTVQNAVLQAIDEYFGELSQKFNATFDANEVYRRALATAGVFNVQSNQWNNIPVLQRKEFYTKGTVNISVV